MAKKPLSNIEIIDQFKKAAAVLNLKDNNFFRVRAYQAAIDSIQSLDEELSAIVARGDLHKIPNIGKELAAKITDLVTKGESSELNKLFFTVPQGMFSLLDIPGIGARKAYRLSTEFDLTDAKTAVEKLKQIAKSGKIRVLDGFGEKSETLIIHNLERVKAKLDRILLDQADKIATTLIDYLSPHPAVSEVVTMGSVRRRKETIGDVDLGVATKNPQAIVAHLKKFTPDTKVEASGDNAVRINFANNKQADIKLAKPEEFGSTLQHFTGSKLHNIALRELALSQNMSLSEHGIKIKGALHPIATEEEFYAKLGLPWIPPELRENIGEIEAARKNKLPKLVKISDVKGEFHTHTNFSWKSSHDYGDSPQALMSAARDLGYSWLALGDHNPSIIYYKEEALTKVVADRSAWLNEQYLLWKNAVKTSDLKIFKTLEVDIRKNGDLALTDAAADYLDFLIVSIHSAFDLPSADQTQRILTALNHPKVKIMAHPTARLLGSRSPVAADWPEIFATCASKHIALEINASPVRLDLPDSLVKQALEAGVKLSLGSDAHKAAGLGLMPYAVDVARRGWAQKSDIINTYTFLEVTEWLAK